MDKSRWLDFVSSRLKSQISLENSEKAETWAFILLALASFGAALASVAANRDPAFIAGTKVLFMVLFYAILLLGVHLPAFLQKGEKPLARLFGIRDFTALSLFSIGVTFYAVILWMLSHQLATSGEAYERSAFFTFVAWFSDLAAFLHLAACLFFVIGLAVFPKALVKIAENGGRFRYPLLALHSLLFLLLGFVSAEKTPLGSPDFFEQFRAAGLFWIFALSSLLLIGQWLRPSSVPSLAALELDVASGRLDRPEDILTRFKDAFISRRLVSWLGRLSSFVANQTGKIASFAAEAMSLVSRENPSEVDLNQVEDRYRKAEAFHQQLNRENQRFLLSVFLFDLNEAARFKVEELRDQFSRELRNAKIEVASVRKRIDEQLVSIKNRPPLTPTPTTSTSPLTAAPTA